MSVPDPAGADGPLGDNEPDAAVDPGLQAERTKLAWNRTALAVGVIGLLMLHPFHPRTSLANDVPGFIMVLLAACTWWYGAHRYRVVVASVRAGRSITAMLNGRRFVLVCLIPAALGLWAVLS